jgi:hypothetical protein
MAALRAKCPNVVKGDSHSGRESQLDTLSNSPRQAGPWRVFNYTPFTLWRGLDWVVDVLNEIEGGPCPPSTASYREDQCESSTGWASRRDRLPLRNREI